MMHHDNTPISFPGEKVKPERWEAIFMPKDKKKKPKKDKMIWSEEN